jgi:hypothetical protein
MLDSVKTIKYQNTSPAKKLRSLQRFYSFQKKKLAVTKPLLTIAHLKPIDINPVEKKTKLVMENASRVNILPQPKSQHLTFSRPTLCSILPSPPGPQHHPNIVEACKMLYGKHPDQLSSEERNHFSGYRQWKMDNGEPIEEDFVYNPTDQG